MTAANGHWLADSPSVRHARRDRATWWAAILASVGIHFLVFVLWHDAGPGAPDSAAAWSPTAPTATPISIEAVTIAAAARPEVPAPPRPVLAVDMPSLAAPDLMPSTGTPVLRPAAQIGVPEVVREGLVPPGIANIGGDYLPPKPRSILPNWRVPRSVEGLDIVARVFVDEGGRALRGVELSPPTPDWGFNRRLADRVRRLDYSPALRNGRPVAGWAEIRFVFCPPTVTATSPPGPLSERSRPCPLPPDPSSR